MEKVKDGKGTSESKGGWTQKGSWNGDWNVGFCKGDGGKGQGRKGTRVQVLQGYNIDGDMNNTWGWSDSAVYNRGRLCLGDDTGDSDDQSIFPKRSLLGMCRGQRGHLGQWLKW